MLFLNVIYFQIIHIFCDASKFGCVIGKNLHKNQEYLLVSWFPLLISVKYHSTVNISFLDKTENHHLNTRFFVSI